jgi:hypothetical protein
MCFLFFGLTMSVGFWLIGLRPYLYKLGKQRSGASFLQGIFADLEEGRYLADSGDKKALLLVRIIWFGILVFVLGFITIIIFQGAEKL